MSEGKDTKGSFWALAAAFGLGAVTGALIALAVAPQSGAETRDDVRSTMERLRKQAAKLAEEMKGLTSQSATEHEGEPEEVSGA